jgi:hypothetical protein
MPEINDHDTDAFFSGFTEKFNAGKLAEAFPSPEEKKQLKDLGQKLGAAIQHNEDAEKVWQTLGSAKDIAIRLLKLAI